VENPEDIEYIFQKFPKEHFQPLVGSYQFFPRVIAATYL